jgi:hypothetical protein
VNKVFAALLIKIKVSWYMTLCNWYVDVNSLKELAASNFRIVVEGGGREL